MNLLMHCSQCVDGGRFPCELLDGGVLQTRCPNDHDVVVVVQCPTFELFFELGCVAFLGRDFRAAVLDASSAIDHFKIFAAQLQMLRAGVPADRLRALGEGLRREQDGAFLLAYALGTSEAFPDKGRLARAQEIRNDVAHNGRIPTQEAARKYLEAIFAIIRRAMRAMRLGEGELTTLVGVDLADRFSVSPSGVMTRTVMAPATMLALTMPDRRAADSFDEDLEDLRNRAGFIFDVDVAIGEGEEER